LAHSGEVAVAVDTTDKPLLVPGETTMSTTRESIERCSPLRREQIPTELETCQHTQGELPSARYRMDHEMLVVTDIRGSFAVNFIEHDGGALVDYVNHVKAVKEHD
jgi:hypothetical protein